MIRVEVDWMDSGLARSDGWESTNTVMTEMSMGRPVTTSGLYLGEDDEKIVVALTRDPENDMWFSAFGVLKKNITAVRTLRVREEVKEGPDGRYFSEDA